MNADTSRYKDAKRRQEYKNRWKRNYYRAHPELRKEERKRVNMLRIKNKKRAIEFLGGKCQVCGYDKYIGALEFHHPPEVKKERRMRDVMSRRWETVVKQIKDCILFCSNCHKEHHARTQ